MNSYIDKAPSVVREKQQDVADREMMMLYENHGTINPRVATRGSKAGRTPASFVFRVGRPRCWARLSKGSGAALDHGFENGRAS